jgi:hypothetical protein
VAHDTLTLVKGLPNVLTNHHRIKTELSWQLQCIWKLSSFSGEEKPQVTLQALLSNQQYRDWSGYTDVQAGLV